MSDKVNNINKQMPKGGKQFARRPPFKNNGKGNRLNRRNKKGTGSRFLSNAKGYGKKGNFGRGTHIEEDQFKYFLGILTALNKPCTSAEERVSMANNVLEQTKEQEINLASNQIVCKVLENLIGFADHGHLERFFEAFGENLRPLCSDPFASHVLQKMLGTALIRAFSGNKVDDEEEEEDEAQYKRPKLDCVTDLKYNLTTEFAEDHRTKCSEFVLRASKFLLNNLEDYVWDNCGSYLIRTCILSLSGLHAPKVPFIKGKPVSKGAVKTGANSLADNKTTFDVPSEWIDLMKEFVSRLEMWPQFKDFPYKLQSAGLVGVICEALSHVDKKGLERLGKKLLSEAFVDVKLSEIAVAQDNEENGDEVNDGADEDEENNANDSEPEEENENEKSSAAEDEFKANLPSVFKIKSSVRLLENLMCVAGPKLLGDIYTTLFAGRILGLAKGRHINFAVQKLLINITDKTVFEEVFDKLVDHLEEFIEIGNTGLVSSLSSACLRLNNKQAAFVTALQKTLHCTTENGADRPKSFFACMLKMKPVEVLPYDKSNYVVLFGSLIIQDILQFNKPIFLVNCILETPPKDLAAVFQLPNGCFIANAFLKSKFIGEKSREKFIKLLEGFYMDLALGRCGSRVLETFFEASNEGQKLRIAKELSSNENKLKGTIFGRIIFNALRLETFKLSPEQWKASWTAKGNKSKEMLSKISPKKRPAT